jgi:ribosome-associated protein
MKDGLFIQSTITIPEHELEIVASRSGGPGGQHVNKTSSRITVRWNVRDSAALPAHLKERVLNKLAHQISTEGFISVSNSSSRSQHQNKEAALETLAILIRNALRVPKKRIATKMPTAIHEARLHAKSKRGVIKKQRRVKIDSD